MTDFIIDLLQMAVMLTDGFGILASWMLAMYFRAERTRYSIFTLYVFFLMMMIMFVVFTVSDVMIITGELNVWTEHPIMRGLVFRLLLTLSEFWLLHRLNRHDNKRL